MTPEAQQAALAHVDGWREAFPKAGPPHKDTSRGGILLPYRWVNERTHARLYRLPDYLKDLNAVHEVEDTALDTDSMSQRGEIAYLNCLEEICGCNASAVRSSAAQRTEALLRTLKLWTD